MSSLDDFFRESVSMLKGQQDAQAVEAKLGPCATGTEALQYYGKLQRLHRERQLAELFPLVKARIQTRGKGVWQEIVGDYLSAHPPHHWSLPHIGAPFADWLFANDPEGALLGPICDWGWTSWLARHAPDDFEHDGLEVRLFIRQFGVDPVASRAALREDAEAPIEAKPTTMLMWRDERTGRIRSRAPSMVTIAVLWRRSGQKLQGALAQFEEDAMVQERARLFREGALPRPS